MNKIIIIILFSFITFNFTYSQNFSKSGNANVKPTFTSINITKTIPGILVRPRNNLIIDNASTDTVFIILDSSDINDSPNNFILPNQQRAFPNLITSYFLFKGNGKGYINYWVNYSGIIPTITLYQNYNYIDTLRIAFLDKYNSFNKLNSFDTITANVYLNLPEFSGRDFTQTTNQYINGNFFWDSLFVFTNLRNVARTDTNNTFAKRNNFDTLNANVYLNLPALSSRDYENTTNIFNQGNIYKDSFFVNTNLRNVARIDTNNTFVRRNNFDTLNANVYLNIPFPSQRNYETTTNIYSNSNTYFDSFYVYTSLRNIARTDTINTHTATNNFSKIVTTANSSNPVSISALNIDWSFGNVFYKTLSANSTVTMSNLSDGQIITVALTNTASNYTVTWSNPSGNTIVWSGGTPPTQTIGAKTDIYTFVKIGSIIYGTYVQNY